jgi:hypothetical protein
MQIHLLAFYISPGHNFRGHHGKPPGNNPVEFPQTIGCVEGKGIRGDRYFGFKEDYKGQITFFGQEVFEAAYNALPIQGAPPENLRRNVLTQGVDLNTLIGQTFRIGDVLFQGTVECAPCYWMDQAFATGMEDFLKGRGGLRARILSSGELSLGSAQLEILPAEV